MVGAVSLSYRLTVNTPERHVAGVELEIAGAAALGEVITLRMAAWSPGSYVIRDYARHVSKLVATDGGGRVRPAAKVSKDTWQVERQDADVIRVSYQVYGHDLTVRTNHIDDTHAFLHGPATYLIVDGARDGACRVEVRLPEAARDGRWHVTTALAPDPDAPDAAGASALRFVARDTDELLDSPIHAGQVAVRAFTAAGAPTELAIWGEPETRGVADINRLVADLTAIVEVHAARLGGPPYARYAFILMLSPDGYGGLEHQASSVSLHTPFAFATRKRYEELLELLSHEYFHVWNGTRMAPRTLRPVDYGREMYTRALWVVEGLTSYYDRHAVVLARRLKAARYLEKLAEDWGRLLAVPGRAVHSVEDASHDAWIKLYRPDEHNVNSTVSYYLKGGLVALALDLRIRRHSGGERTLDHALAALWEQHRSEPYDDVQPVFERATGLDLREFFDRFVRGREDPELAAALGWAGLSLVETWNPEQCTDGRTPVWLGVTFERGALRVASVLDGSPAMRAGISPGDTVIALDRYQVKSVDGLRERLGARSPGDAVRLSLFRRERLTEARLVLAASPPSRIEVRAQDAATDEQKAFYRAWLADEWPGAGTVAAVNSEQWI